MSYSITRFNLNTEHVTSQGARRAISIVGDPDAVFSLTAHTDDTTALYYNWASGTWSTTFDRIFWQKIDATGTFNTNITFPTETADTVYSVQLMAEPHYDTKLEISNVLSPVVLIRKIYQYIDRKITFTSSSDSHASKYTLPTNVEVSGPPSIVTIDDIKTQSAGKGDVEGSISWTYTVNDDSNFIIAKQPSINDFKSTTTKLTTSTTAAYAETDVAYSTQVKLNNVDGLAVGMKITGVSSGSLDGTPSITAIDRDDCSSTYKVITFDSTQTFANDITLTFTGFGNNDINTMHDILYQFNNPKIVLNDVVTTTTAAVSDSTTVPVTSISGIKPKSTPKKVSTSVTSDIVTMSDDISDLGVGQVLVSASNGDTITGTATITKVNADSKKITFDEVVTLTAGTELVFASALINSVNICDTSKPYVESISGLNLTTNKNVTLDDTETLTFTGSSNSATITADIIVAKMGESDKTVTLQLDNILKVS